MKKLKEPWYWLAFKIIVFYTFLSSASSCMTYGNNPYIDMALTLLTLLMIPMKYYHVTMTKILAATTLILAAVWTMHGNSLLTAYLAQAFMVLLPAQLLMLRNDLRAKLFDSLSNWYAILLAASIVWWMLYLIGIPLPHTSTIQEWQYNDFGCQIDNYFLFSNETNLSPWAPVIEYYRYNGFFLEPGHMGTITAFILFANKFDFSKRRNLVMLFAIIITFSAATYTVIILGYLMIKYREKRSNVLLIVGVLILLIIAVSIYNGGDNYINNLIIGKLTRKEGAIDGRFAEWTIRLWDKAMRHNQLIFGFGADILKQLTQSAGYKVYILQNGFFGLGITMLAYWLIQRTTYSRLGYMMYLLYVVSWLQRTYCFWDAYLDSFILGLPYLIAPTETNTPKLKTSISSWFKRRRHVVRVKTPNLK